MKKRNKPDYLIFLGTNYNSPILQIEQYLPSYLSKYRQVICFEFPQFKQLINIITRKTSLIEKKGHNLIIFHSFGLLPFGRTFIFINFINHFFSFILLKILLRKDIHKFKIITFTTELTFLLYFLRDTPIFYYIQDNYFASPWWNNILAKIQVFILEKILLHFVYKILIVSKPLKYKIRSFSNSFYFPPPANTKQLLVNKLKRANKSFFDLMSIRHPIAGLIGTFAEWKINMDLLNEIINKYSAVTFVFLGLMSIKNSYIKRNLLSKTNVKYLGCKSIKDLPIYISQFDICIMPYNVNNYGNYAYPVKIMEYLAMGKPVVSTALPSIKYLSDKGLIYWAKNNKEFIEYIRFAIQEKKRKSLIERRMEEAKRNDWSIRIKEFIKIVEEK